MYYTTLFSNSHSNSIFVQAATCSGSVEDSSNSIAKRRKLPLRKNAGIWAFPDMKHASTSTDESNKYCDASTMTDDSLFASLRAEIPSKDKNSIVTDHAYSQTLACTSTPIKTKPFTHLFMNNTLSPVTNTDDENVDYTDLSYNPNDDDDITSISGNNTTFMSNNEEHQYAAEKKFIVFESSLSQLFKFCQLCGICIVEKTT